MKKYKYNDMIKNVSVAAVSIVLSGALIVGAINHVKEKNVKSSSPTMGKGTIEVTTDGVTKVVETTSEFESETETFEETTEIKETKEVQETKETKENIYDDKAIKSAVEQFTANEKLWKHVFDNTSGTPSYAMTDLDHNGNPEVIVAAMGGTTKNTYMHIYELVDGKIIDRIEDGGIGRESTFSLPDLMDLNKLTTYYDGARYVYVAPDNCPIIGDGKDIMYEHKNVFLLENGIFGNERIATKKTENGKISCTDRNNIEITEKEFNQADRIIYSEEEGYERSITYLKWTELTDGNKGLLDSYKTFLGIE